MIILEYRIVLPISVEEYQVAQLHAVAEASKGETGGGEGVEVLINEPYTKENEEGQYTNKIYHIASKMPGYISKMVPKKSMQLREEAWNAYPYCKTVLTNEFLKEEKFAIEICTWHKADLGDAENVHGLNDEDLKKRVVEYIDIAEALTDQNDYKEDEDPTLFKSEKTGRGPLCGNWIQELKDSKTPPYMCCYKLVKAHFNYFGFQTKVEKLIKNFETKLFTNFHRKLFCSMDKWHGLTMEDIRKLEDETKAELDKMRMEGEVKEVAECS